MKHSQFETSDVFSHAIVYYKDWDIGHLLLGNIRFSSSGWLQVSLLSNQMIGLIIGDKFYFISLSVFHHLAGLGMFC